MKDPIRKLIFTLAILLFAAAGAFILWQQKASRAPEKSVNISQSKTDLETAGIHGQEGPPESDDPSRNHGSRSNPMNTGTPTASDDDYAFIDSLILADEIDHLLERAKSDPSLSYALADRLTDCAVIPDALDAIESGSSGHLTPTIAASMIDDVDSRMTRCGELTKNYDREIYSLVTQSAEAGVIEAQINYSTYASRILTTADIVSNPALVQDFRNNTLRFAHQAAATGDPDALFNAYQIYSQGQFVDRDPARAHHFLHRYYEKTGNSTVLPLLNSLSKEKAY